MLGRVSARRDPPAAQGSTMATTRPLLLLQARNPDDPMRAHEVQCFAEALAIAPEALIVVNGLERLPTRAELAACAGVLIGGSGDYSVLDPHGWIQALIAFAREELIAAGRPTFGSCFGFQLLVLALGGAMRRDPLHGEVGTIRLQRSHAADDDPIFGPLPAYFDAQVGHNDRATSLPGGVRVLASSPLCPIHALRVERLPVWATQFHPELTHRSVADRFLRYRALYGSPDRSGDEAFLRALTPSPESTALLPRFAAWVAAHGPP